MAISNLYTSSETNCVFSDEFAAKHRVLMERETKFERYMLNNIYFIAGCSKNVSKCRRKLGEMKSKSKRDIVKKRSLANIPLSTMYSQGCAYTIFQNVNHVYDMSSTYIDT